MANSETVFQQNYLPVHICKEIMLVLFGPEAAGENEQLYKMLRSAMAKRDEHALLYPTLDNVKNLEKRYDMQELKQAYEALWDDKGGEHLSIKRALGAYSKRRVELRKLLV